MSPPNAADDWAFKSTLSLPFTMIVVVGGWMPLFDHPEEQSIIGGLNIISSNMVVVNNSFYCLNTQRVIQEGGVENILLQQDEKP